MFTVPDDLVELPDDALYDLLDGLAEYRRRHGRGRSEAAYHVKAYCKAERARVKAELRARKLPGTRPGDDRCYGPGRAGWQCASGKKGV